MTEAREERRWGGRGVEAVEGGRKKERVPLGRREVESWLRRLVLREGV